MDLFDVLVRLDLAGWKSHPPGASVDDPGSSDLQRLLRKTSALEYLEQTYDFTGVEGPGPPFDSDRSPLCLSKGAQTVWLLPFDPCVIVRIEDQKVTVLATSIQGFLEHLLDPRAISETAAEPLGSLGFDGDGVGWQLQELSTPTRLIELPDNTRLQIAQDCIWVGHRVREVEHAVKNSEPEHVGPDLGELFGAGSGRARPRTGLVALLLFVGVLLTILGMACIAAPGGLLVLLAWFVVEKDHDRVESGYLPEADRPAVERSRNLTHAGLLLVVSLFFLQAMLLCFGGYDALLDDVYIPLWRQFIRGMMGAPMETDLPV